MKIFFFRLLFILVLVFFEFSFFDILFPRIVVPVVLVVSVIVWTLIIDFPRVLYIVVPLAAFFDIVASGTLGALTLYAVLLSYATSFLSRRLLVEHHGMGMTLYALFASGGSFGYIVFHFIFFQGTPFSFFGVFSHFFLTTASSEFLLPIFLSALLFPFLHWIIRHFETHVRFIAQREILQVR